MAKTKHQPLVSSGTLHRRSQKMPTIPMKEVRFLVPKKSGMKEVRYLVPDASSPEFRKEMKRAAKLLKNSQEEREIDEFIEAMMVECLRNEAL